MIGKPEDEWLGIAGCIGFALLCLVVRWVKRWRRRHDLDRPLFPWTSKDWYSARDLVNGGLLILGMTGGGKSSSSGRQISRALIRDRNTYGVILAAKPEDLAMWRGLFREFGQGHRLLVFDADKSKLRFNFLEEAGRYGGDTREITQCITTIGETLRSGDRRSGGENAAFFAEQTERTIHFAVEILKVARGKVTASDLQQFITTSAAGKPHLVKDQTWQETSFHCEQLQAAHDAPKSRQGIHDFQQASDFWCSEAPSWSDRLASSILAGVFGILFVFNSGVVHERVSTTTNFSFQEMRRKRQWLLVNTPPAVEGANGVFIASGFKYLMQRFVLLQEARRGDPINVCWCDDAAPLCNTFDAVYNSQSRSHLGTTVFLSQSIESFHASMKGEAAKQHALALVANFSHRIIHALGSVESAEWASRTLGLRLETHMGGSVQLATSVFDELMGHTQFTGSFSNQYEPVLQPAAFLTGLARTGGPKNRFLCDAIVIRPGRPFSTGENWLKVTFSQR